MPVIRVSAAAVAEFKRRAVEEGRTVVSVVDRLLGVVKDAPVKSSRPRAMVASVAEEVCVTSGETGFVAPVARCVCGHTAVHHKDETGRCQRPECYPNGCRAFRAS